MESIVGGSRVWKPSDAFGFFVSNDYEDLNKMCFKIFKGGVVLWSTVVLVCLF